MQNKSQKIEDANYLASIIDNTDDAVIGKSLTGEILSWNRGAEKIYGYSKKEIVGKSIATIIPEDRKYEKDRFLDQIVSGEKVDHFETLRRRKDGQLINVSLTISPIKDLSGKIIGASTIARDITVNKKLQLERIRREQELQMGAIVNTVLDGIITIDELGTVQSFNPSAERIFGYTSSEVIGKNVKLLMPNPYHDEHDKYLSNYMRTGSAQIIGTGREAEGIRKNGETFPLELAISELWMGDDRFFVGMVRDISVRKENEKSLFQAKEEA